MNRTFGIVYPLFELEVEGKIIPQSAKPVATLDWTTPTTTTSVEITRSALGVSTLAALSKINKRNAANEVNDTTTTPI